MANLDSVGFYSLSEDRVKNTSLTSQMKRCEIIITEYCNFKCPYCRKLDPSIWKSNIKQMSLEDITKTIDYWCEGLPLENIRFSGGEPTLHKDIKDIVTYTSNKGINRIAISTNGSNKLDLYKELINRGVNDYSISLDACCASDGDKMSGGIKGSWDIVVKNIEELSKLTYVTVGIVLTPDNVQSTIDTIKFADKLGVSDIRVIPAAQYDKPIDALKELSGDILDRHPILKYRVNNYINGLHVRGLNENDSPMCGLMLDDSIVAGKYHFPCVIAFREGHKPIGEVGPNMRQERKDWMLKHNCLKNPICKKNCLDTCSLYNRKFREYHAADPSVSI